MSATSPPQPPQPARPPDGTPLEDRRASDDPPPAASIAVNLRTARTVNHIAPGNGAPEGESDDGAEADLRLPHERDESSTDVTARAVDPVVAQAARDLQNGLVDTDLRAMPGVDADQRAKLLGRRT